MNWVEKIAKTIDNVFTSIKEPLSYLPSLLLLCEVASRPGLSAIGLAAAIIRRLPEAGIHIGPMPDGSANVVTQFVSILSEEFVNELHNNALVEGALQPGSVISSGLGTSSVGPIAVSVSNTIPSSLRGIIR